MHETSTNNSAARAPVTVLGLGAMGQALAGAFLRAGHPTTIWNRTPGKGEALVEQGARRAASVVDAVRASPLVVICVVDHAASAGLLRPAGAALAGRTVVDLTSYTPEQARAAAAWAAEHGAAFLDGAVMVPTSGVGRPDALLLYSGPQATYEAHRATLAALGGNARWLGPDPGYASLHDLALLDLFYTSMASVVHAFALVGADGVSAKAFMPLARDFLALMPEMAEMLPPAIDAGEYPGEFDNIAMESVGISHIIEASRKRGLDVGALVATKAVFDRAIAAGHGADSMSSIITAIRRPSP